MGWPDKASKRARQFDTALHGRQRVFMKRASRRGQHQQQQAVALRVQQPGFCPEGFLPRRILQRGTQGQGCVDPVVEHCNGERVFGLALQAKSQASRLPPAGQGSRQWVLLNPGCGSTSRSSA